MRMSRIKNDPADYLLSSYDFDLPEELIAQHPPERRGDSRLYVLDRNGGAESDQASHFSRLADFLPAGALLAANNSRVVPARITGERPGGGKFEFLLLTPLPLLEAKADPVRPGWNKAVAEALLRPAKKMRPGIEYAICDGVKMAVLEKGEFGKAMVELFWQGDLAASFEGHGALPLPPYIRRAASDKDRERYQTVYASKDKPGSVAAPTAGLHFTPELRAELEARGHEWVDLTLYVGYGTFSPVRAEDIRSHAMHSEYVELQEKAALAVLEAKKQGRPVIAVGTTSARLLEGIAELRASGGRSLALLGGYAGWINTFIYPGRELRVIDGLITNFHLPRSSLLMLVSALTGRRRLLDAYANAVRGGFRFFSYGDAMLIS